VHEEERRVTGTVVGKEQANVSQLGERHVVS
jgi:hypothetical protein